MKKTVIPFTDSELQLLRSAFKRVGDKHEVSGSYVSLIACGKRSTNTKLAKSILKTLNQLLTVLNS